MLPFCIDDSMFGFQRVGDLIWATDQCARDFPVGATSGRTTLGGEGLQHQDGPSHLVIATDDVRAVAEQIGAFLPAGRRCVTLR